MSFATKDGDTTPKTLASALNAANEHLICHQPEDGQKSTLNITADNLVKATPGRCFRVSVIVAGAAGALHDCASIGAAAASNKVGVIPAVVGVYEFNWPHLVGVVIKCGAGQTLSVSYS